MPRSKSKKISNLSYRRLFYVAFVLVLLIILFFVWHNNKSPSTTSGSLPSPTSAQRKAENDENKARIVQDQQSNQQATNGKKQVTVTITNASYNNVTAYVSGVYETGGTCTATFTQNSTTIIRTSSGSGNASYTQCAPINPDLPNSNMWSIVVSYNSNTAEGTSPSQTF